PGAHVPQAQETDADFAHEFATVARRLDCVKWAATRVAGSLVPERLNHLNSLALSRWCDGCLHHPPMRNPTLLAVLVAASCSAEAPATEEVEDGVAVESGKEDNFLSLSAKEFVLEGRSSVTVDAGASDRDVRKIISLKHIAIAWFLNQFF